MTEQGKLIGWFLLPINSSMIRLLIMGLGLCNVGFLMWEPTNYASLIGGFNALKVILLIWSICTSMIVGIGFQPIKPIFRLLFNPYLSLCILLFFTGGILTAL